MEYALVGWPDEGPRLRLDHREFSYAGKFVMSNTGKAVALDAEANDSGLRTAADDDRDWIADDRIVAAVAFNEDRTDPATAWLRYVTVRRDRRGQGVGARLACFVTDRLRGDDADRDDADPADSGPADSGPADYDRVKIAVNNPFAYHALYKAGFGYTGERTGLAELVLARPGDRSPDRYRAGLDAFRERDDLAAEERAFLDAKADADPPDAVPVPE